MIFAPFTEGLSDRIEDALNAMEEAAESAMAESLRSQDNRDVVEWSRVAAAHESDHMQLSKALGRTSKFEWQARKSPNEGAKVFSCQGNSIIAYPWLKRHMACWPLVASFRSAALPGHRLHSRHIPQFVQ